MLKRKKLQNFYFVMLRMIHLKNLKQRPNNFLDSPVILRSNILMYYNSNVLEIEQ